MNLFPMFLKLSGRQCLVVGAGRVGEPKIAGLISAGAKVLVVAPRATEAVEQWARAGKIAWQPRSFSSADLDETFLVVAATSSSKLNHCIFREAQRHNILCNVVDDPAYCDFYYPAVVRRGALQIAISTSGQSPALAQRLRKQLEQQFGPEYQNWVKELGKARRRLMTCGMAPARRARLLHQLASQVPFAINVSRNTKFPDSGSVL
ncbi:MAG: bifunctional precorrin-2 dehydrogenase/sirohydrochlorin ferrochelatase [Acidobacteriia bacterium]|nr:bifunctional precorrin-2 dehydrogenase/sirohydrochlorin ferrochelatase [Terriglobia bacterium]